MRTKVSDVINNADGQRHTGSWSVTIDNRGTRKGRAATASSIRRAKREGGRLEGEVEGALADAKAVAGFEDLDEEGVEGGLHALLY